MAKRFQKPSPFIKRFRLRFVFSAGVVVCAAAVYIFVRPMDIRREHLDSNIKRALDACIEKSGRTFAYECFRASLTKVVTPRTLGVVMDSLETLFATSSSKLKSLGVFTCHPAAHMVGEIAIKKGVPFETVTAACDRSCDFGCSHGAFVAKLKTDRDLVSSVKSLCTQYTPELKTREMFSCGHVVGHGLVEFVSGDARRALDYCDTMHEEARTACGHGVLMEALVGLPDRPKNQQLSVSQILALCDTFPDRYKRECIESVGLYAANIARDPHEARAVCDQVPLGYKERCIYYLASVVYFPLRHEPDKMKDYCLGFGGDYQLACLTGAIDPSIGEKDPFSYGKTVCSGVAAIRLRHECFAFMGDQIAWAQGSEKRDASCSVLPPEDREACLGRK